MPNPHCLGMSTKYDEIYFPSQDSHRKPMPLFENLSFQISWGFQGDCHNIYNPITKWLEQYYLARFITNNKLQPLCVLAKEFSVVNDTFVRSIRGLLNDGFHRKSKNVN